MVKKKYGTARAQVLVAYRLAQAREAHLGAPSPQELHGLLRRHREHALEEGVRHLDRVLVVERLLLVEYPRRERRATEPRGIGRLADQNRLFAGAMIASSPTWTTDVFLGWRHVSGNTVFDDSIIGGFGFRVDF